jgi:hypothetical protein
MENNAGLLTKIKFPHKAVLWFFSILTFMWLSLMTVHLFLDWQHFLYVGLFLLLNAVASSLFVWAVWKEKQKVSLFGGLLR